VDYIDTMDRMDCFLAWFWTQWTIWTPKYALDTFANEWGANDSLQRWSHEAPSLWVFPLSALAESYDLALTIWGSIS